MARIVIIGGAVSGLCGAMMLARDGHQVTVLERDPAPPVDPLAAWDRWERRGVGQFRLAHLLLPRFRQVIESELPGVIEGLEAAGALRANRLAGLPDAVSGGLRPGDERFDIVTGRRPMVEAAIARLADAEPGVDVRRGVAVRALAVEDGRARVPRVTGVVDADGGATPADLVIDAGGRRSAVPDLLAAAGARRPGEWAADSGFVYYSRHFRSADGSLPELLGPALQTYDSIQVAALAADHGYWSVTIVASAADRALRAARHPDVWQRVLRGFPLLAHWVDAEPVTGVDVMAAIQDRVRSFVVDDRPVATGIVAVGDARACTNPSLGRGISLAAMELARLRAVVREVGLADPMALAVRWEDVRAETVEPYVVDTLATSAHRLASLEADVAGVPYETEDPGWRLGNQLLAAAPHDPELLRAGMDVVSLFARGRDVLARPDVRERLRAVGDVGRLPGPDRRELLALVGSAEHGARRVWATSLSPVENDVAQIGS